MRILRHPSLERQSIPLVTWGLLVAVLLLAGAVGALGLYLNGRRIALDHRQAASDQRDERQRVAICGILEQFPPGRNAQLDNARTVYACTPIFPPPTLIRRPRPTRTVTVTPTPRVVTTPGPTRRVVTPGPTVTVTKTARPHHPGKQRPHPTPTPTCTSISVVGMCLHKPEAAPCPLCSGTARSASSAIRARSTSAKTAKATTRRLARTAARRCGYLSRATPDPPRGG